MGKTKVTRRQAREAAMQALFQYDQNPSTSAAAIEQFVRQALHFPALEAFALGLINGVCQYRPEIDGLLTQTADNWQLSRMPPVDRNILRIAVYELRFGPGVPPKVAINEALEICKRFSTAESARFVNGILDRIAGLAPGAPRAANVGSAADETASDPEA